MLIPHVTGQVLGAQGFMSSTESLNAPAGSTHSSHVMHGAHPAHPGHKSQQWKGSTQSLRSVGSRKACEYPWQLLGVCVEMGSLVLCIQAKVKIHMYGSNNIVSDLLSAKVM